MDVILEAADNFVFDKLYQTIPLPEDIYLGFFEQRTSILRQSISLWLITYIFAHVLYFTFSTFSYVYLFDKSLMKSPKFLPNQIRREIWLSLSSFPLTTAVTVPWVLFEVRGHSKIYYHVDGWTGIGWMMLEFIGFILFTDFGVYWIHRLEHQPFLYSWLHKPHHTWKICTPFASLAFHPLDGYFQSLPIHAFVYFSPMNAWLHLACFIFVQIWSVAIHDAAYFTSHPWINGSAHHTVHHLEFNYNYGQYFTLWDRIGGTHRYPHKEFCNGGMFFEKFPLFSGRKGEDAALIVRRQSEKQQHLLAKVAKTA